PWTGLFYSLALTFGTLLSSQGTDASFVLTLSGFPPGASLRYFVFRLYQILFRAVPGPDLRSDFPSEGMSTTLAEFPAGSQSSREVFISARKSAAKQDPVGDPSS
ncbi:hypothetical protein, partial [Streptomyces sp. I05A-00742]|uniref:hypothetical protein n=1 Tax=Streptomyces sp. I05A-00742 TaxID=2732853 RepID=UPI001BB15CB0